MVWLARAAIIADNGAHSDDCRSGGQAMPLFHGDMHGAPAWCELSSFEIVRLPIGGTHRFTRCGPQERLIVAAGSCLLAWDEQRLDASRGDKIELRPEDGALTVTDVREPATLVRLCGAWGEETGGWGLFTVQEIEHSAERGDPTAYPKRTNIDNHYHDCDEFWILLEGRGTAVSEGTSYAVGPGDCLATRMGDHHDFPLAPEPVTAVYFETTLRGEMRRGHLWNHTHGPAQPLPDRA
jgi:mannose-6-phosphate isomerase-like protein (cupin superfamily)